MSNAESVQAIAWNHLKTVSNLWIHEPDFNALRIILATAKALDLDTRPVWTMLIGPSGTGKTAYYIQSALGYPVVEVTDQVTVAGIYSASKGKQGTGILDRLGRRGLWVFPDFTVILNMREDRRNDLFGIQRRIYDGSYYRDCDGEKIKWAGRVHSIAASTPAIERYYHVHADLGQRYLQVRIEKAHSCDELVRKSHRQNANWEQFQGEIKDAAANYLSRANGHLPTVPFAISRKILDWADFISLCRQPISRNYRDEITSVAGEEGPSRIEQQMHGLLQADAWLMGQMDVDYHQTPLIERLAFDCLPRDRRAVLVNFRTDDALPGSDVQILSGISHPYAFARAVDELVAIGVLAKEGEGTMAKIKLRLTERVIPLLTA